MRKVDFFEYRFLVPKGVFLPRPETEILVEVARDYLKDFIYDKAKDKSRKSESQAGRRWGSDREMRCSERDKENLWREQTHKTRQSVAEKIREILGTEQRKKRFVVADVGTGTGCIIISLERQLWKYIKAFELDFVFVGIDISKKAVLTAKKNAKMLSSKTEFVLGDMLSPLKYADFIISNPPYVSLKLRDRINVDDPPLSLFGGEEGYELTLKLITESAKKLRAGGYLFLEVGYDDLKFFNMNQLRNKTKKVIFSHAGKWFHIYPPVKDYLKLERILIMKKVREPEKD